jgi:chemotaxis protein CheC
MIETLRTVCAAGARQAGEAISTMTGLELTFTPPGVRTVPLDDVAGLLGGPEAAVVALHLEILGDGRGNLLIALSPSSAERLLDAMLPAAATREGGRLDDLTALDRSGLLEMGNILAAAYLGAVGACLGRRLIPSVPSLSIDMAGSVVECLLIDVTRGHDAALVVDTALRAAGEPLDARVLFLHEPAALPVLLRSLRRDASAGSTGGA